MTDNQKQIQSLEKDLLKTFEAMLANWKITDFNYKNADGFFKSYSQNVSDITSIIEDLQTWNNTESQQHDIQKAENLYMAKDTTEFLGKSGQEIQDKTNELQTKQTLLTADIQSLKDAVEKIDTKKLSEIKVYDKSALHTLFAAISEIFFGRKDFNWKHFKGDVIQKGIPKDFKKTLTDFKFETLSQEHIQKIVNIKDNKELSDFAATSKTTFTHLLDYLKLVPEVSQLLKDSEELTKNIEFIKENIPIKQNLEVNLAERQRKIEEESALLKKKREEYTKFIDGLKEHVHQFEKISKGATEQKTLLEKNVVAKYNEIQSVPSTVYV